MVPTTNFDSFFQGGAGDYEESPRGARGGGRIPSIVICGDFSMAGGNSATRIAEIPTTDGTWQSLSTGLSGVGRKMEVFQNKLYVTGSFATAGGISVDRIASWDGITFAPLGGGLDFGSGNVLRVHQSKLYVGGNINTVDDGLATGKIAIWDGSAWSAFIFGDPQGGSTNLECITLISASDGELWAGGQFTAQAGGAGTTIGKIGHWDGSSWTQPNGGVLFTSPPRVRRIIEYKGEIWLGGTFSSAGGVSGTANLCKFDGTVFVPVYTTNAPTSILAMEIIGDDLYVGGNFTNLDGVSGATNIARFDGVNWNALGDGLSSTVQDMIATSDDLLVTVGGFLSTNTPSSITLNRVGFWDGTTWAIIDGGTNGLVRGVVLF